MSDYAVIDPATGETVKEYPTISDDALRDAIAKADATHREWSATTPVAERAGLIRRVGELHTERWARSSCARWASRSPRPSARSSSAPPSMTSTPTTPRR